MAHNFQSFSEFPDARLRRLRVVASDIDGTITSGSKIPVEVLEAFAALERAGLLVVLVTGRSAGWGHALATYLPSVVSVVAENGLVLFDAECARHDLGPAAQASFPHSRLRENAQRVAALLHLSPTDDDVFRLFERTLIRSAALSSRALDQAASCLDSDFELTASSIHVHVRPRGWSKADGLQVACNRLLDDVTGAVRSDFERREDVLFVGDSANDGPVFAKLHDNTVGVANVFDHVDELGDNLPRYVLENKAAAGFLEATTRIVRVRQCR